jgi:hypothetical protein
MYVGGSMAQNRTREDAMARLDQDKLIAVNTHFYEKNYLQRKIMEELKVSEATFDKMICSTKEQWFKLKARLGKV